MNLAICLKSILAGIVSVGLSHAMEQSNEMTSPAQITSVERAEGANISNQQKILMVDLWMFITKNDFDRRFREEFMNGILPTEVKVSIRQIDPTVTDERMLQLLKDTAGGDFSPRIPADDASMVKYGRVERWVKVRDFLGI